MGFTALKATAYANYCRTLRLTSSALCDFTACKHLSVSDQTPVVSLHPPPTNPRIKPIPIPSFSLVLHPPPPAPPLFPFPLVSSSKIHPSFNLSLKFKFNHCPSSLTISIRKPIFSSSPFIRSLSSKPNNTFVPIMATSFKPEQARASPALPLPTPPLTKFKIGLCQLSVTADKERNIAHARGVIEDATEKGAKLVLLPEIWNSPYSNDSFPVYAEDIDGGGEASPSTAMLSEVARRLQITIVGWSIPERSDDRLYNTCCVFDSDGKLKAKHGKIHLFDIDILGKITFIESRTLTVGDDALKGMFLSGLRQEVKAELRQLQPKRLTKLMERAKQIEGRNWALERAWNF